MFKWSEIFLFVLLLVITVPAVGKYMAYVFRESSVLNLPVLTWLEKGIYKICGINPDVEMGWKSYLKALLIFNLFGLTFLFLILSFQNLLPLNTQDFSNMPLLSAFNIAVSFTTNTTWEMYPRERTMSYFTQMAGITTQNFLSAATGNAVLLVFIRGLSRKNSATVGNFWKDLTRTIVYLFLPICIIFSLFLVSQGVIQTLSPYVKVTTIEGQEQLIPMGPDASSIAIKQLTTNGGGISNANSAHPFENPSPLTNFLETFIMLLIPAAATQMYGEMIHSMKQARVIFGAMLILWLGGTLISSYSENLSNPVMAINPFIEGEETRFLNTESVLWIVTASASANGGTNSNISSLSPLASGIAMFNMMSGEVIFGGIGIGLCKMLMFALITAFLGCLIVGRNPEFLGKKIEGKEVFWIMFALIVPSILILSGACFIIFFKHIDVNNQGPHGLSAVIYMLASTVQNNGSTFISFNYNTDFYNLFLAIVMLISRLTVLISCIFIGGILAAKKVRMTSIGTFSTDTFLFGIYLTSIIFILVLIIFLPALVLGPLTEHLLMLRGKAF